MVVAALGNAQIGVMLRRGENPLGLLGLIDIAEELQMLLPIQNPVGGLYNIAVAAGTQDAVHLGHLLQNL